MKQLEWYALRYDFNSNELVNINVLGKAFIDDINKRIKQDKISSYMEFKKAVISYLRWRYWGKSEYEMFVSDLWDKKQEKIDIYRQLEPNIDRICEYVIKELKLKIGE